MMRLYPDATHRWMVDQSARFRSAETARTYKKVLRLLQQQHPGKAISQFTEDNLADFVQCGRLGPEKGEVSTSTMAQRQQVITGLYEWASWRGIVDRNPAVGLKFRLSYRRTPVKTHRWLSLEETRQLILATEGSSMHARRDRVILLAGLLAGLRLSEISGLDWGKVDVSNRTITLVGKGNKLATIAAPPQLRDAVEAWRGTRRPVSAEPLLCRFRNYTDWTKGSTRGTYPCWDERLGGTGVSAVIRRRAKEAGLGVVAPHDLRRTFAGILEERGKKIEDISKALRHSSVATTQRYLESNSRKTVAITQDLEI
jgi:integrase/recombinase XerD